MAELFGDFNEFDISDPVSSGGDVSTSLPIPAAQPMADLKQPDTIMTRMKSLGSWLVDPSDPTIGVASSPLSRIGQTFQAVGSAFQGKHDFWQQQGALEERMRSSAATRTMEKARLGLAQQEGARQEATEKRKQEGLERFKARDWTKILSGPTSGIVDAAKDIIDFDADAGLGLIKLGIEAQKNETVRAKVIDAQNQLSKATTREEAGKVLLGLDPAIAKELDSVVKLAFPEEGKEKSVVTNDVITFVESGGRIRPPTVPPNLTIEEGKKIITSQRSMAQQQINVTMGQQQFSRASSIKDDYTRQVKDYEATRVNQRKFEDLTKQGSKINDLALVRQGMMAMDPPNAPSVVRETEAELVERARENILFQPLQTHLERIAGKRTLTDKQREDIATLVRNSYQARRTGYEEQRKIYSDFARQAGLDPKGVLGEELPPVLPKKGEKPGSKEQRLKALGF